MSPTLIGRRHALRGAALAAVAATLPALPALAHAGADQPLVDAEVEITRLFNWLADDDSEDNSPERMAAFDRAYDLEDFVRLAKPATIVGAAVKLRRILDIDLGIATGHRESDFPALLQILALLHEIGGRPNHPMRACGSPFEEGCRVEGTAALPGSAVQSRPSRPESRH